MVKLPKSSWTWQVAYGMPSRPNFEPGLACSFSAPLAPGSIHYLTVPTKAKLAGSVGLTMTIEQEPGTVWQRKPEAGNTGTHPPSARIYLERRGMKLSLDPKQQFHRLWSCNHWVELKPGTFSISVPLVVENWLGVLGKKDAAGLAGMLANLSRIGVTFGGGSFYGHGVQLASGSARVKVELKL